MRICVKAFVAVAAGLGGCGGASLAPTYKVPSVSMEPSFTVGEQISVDYSAYARADPRINDVVMFHPPRGAVDSPTRCGTSVVSNALCSRPTSQVDLSVKFFKRVVAGPGDTIALRSGHVILNGKEQPEPFIVSCAGGRGCDYPTPITIPPGDWFVLGDNRGDSDDSRFWGPVPKSSILGKVTTGARAGRDAASPRPS